MSSTNKTTNYELSQFVGSDKPAWLSDYNGDMSKIDAGIHSAQTTATGADGKADTNATNIGTLSNLTTTAKTSLVAAINEVDSNADTAQNTATSAADTASQASSAAAAASTGITNITNYLDINTFTEYSNTAQFTKNLGGGSVSAVKLYVARNTAGTLGKIYGYISCSGVTGNSQSKITLNVDTGLRPTTDIDIYMGGILNSSDTTNVTITVKTDGKLEFSAYQPAGTTPTLRFFPCLYFMQNFGDTPE